MYFSGKSLLGASKLFQPCYMDINIYIRYFFSYVLLYLSYQLLNLTLIIIEIRLKINMKIVSLL